jgi:hypothetical protein
LFDILFLLLRIEYPKIRKSRITQVYQNQNFQVEKTDKKRSISGLENKKTFTTGNP